MSTSALHAALLTASGQHAIITPQADGSDRPLVRAAAVLAALTAVVLTAYLLVIAAHDVPYVVRARLATLTAVLVVLTGATLISLAALRVQRRQRAGDLASLRGHLDRQAAGYRVAVEEGMARREAVVGRLVDQMGTRLEVVEQRACVGLAPQINGEQPAEEVGGELVPMPNSRAFQLGREVERRRWERQNGDS